jgi:translocation and assembly module TamB
VDARLEDLGPLGAAAALEAGGEAASLKLAATLGGAPLLDLGLRLPFDLPGLLQRPEATLRALPEAPLTGALDVPGLDLAAVAGKAGLPDQLAGKLRGSAALGGTLAAPRGRATLAVAGLEVLGHRDLTGRVEVSAEPQRSALLVRLSAGEAEALRLDASLGAPPERLVDPAVLRGAALSLEAAVPGLPLGLAAGRALPLDGTLSAKLAVQGTLASPEGRLDLAGTGLVIDGRPLGDLTAVVRYLAPTGTAELKLEPTAGGVLWAGGTVAAPLGLDLTWAALRAAPASLRVTSDRLDLGFLPAVAPGLVRVASGPLTVDLAASGPLDGLRPRGTVKLEGGRVAIVELGDWSDLAVEASIGDRSFEVSKLEARRGQGRLSGRLALHGLATPRATLEGRLDFRRFSLSRAGMEVVNLELPLEVTGTMSEDLLDATVTIPSGKVRLPKKTPRALQALDGRADIKVGRPKAKRPSWFDAPDPAAGGPAPRPFEARCRILVPDRIAVLGESPEIDLEVKADVTLRAVGGELLVSGPVEVVKGKVEPISGRIFQVQRGRVTFPGAGFDAGQLDVTARYDNPAAQVTVTIGGTVPKPTIQLASRPPMDDAAIAMLIATGRTEIKANTSAISSVSGKDAGSEGNVATDAAMSLAFQGLVSDKLPVDQVSIDSTTLRAGKYLTDTIFIGYARRWDAKREQGENENEVKAELRLTPRWNFELRYGDAQSGDASLIWQKDY